MYLGPRTPTPSPEGGHGIQYMFFDSEGINGTKTPVMTEWINSIMVEQTQTLTHFFGYAKKKDCSMNEAQTKAMMVKRMKHVNESYPKLLYLFGDVMLFVTTQSWKEKEKINEVVLTWARTAGGGAVDHGVKPKLIVIFNTVTAVKYMSLFIFLFISTLLS